MLAAAPPAESLETKLERVAPESQDTRTEGQARAVLLIHGLRAHPFSAKNTRAAELHDWQRPGSPLVTALATSADVFSFAYGQNVSIPDVAKSDGLRDAIDALGDAGYREIVLLGHSSGAVIARELVQNDPECGVTRVVQVSPPNAGSHLVRALPYVHGTQTAFLSSIRPAERVAASLDKKIPEHVEMVVVMGDGFAVGDLAVRDEWQWPPDLQAQGIPVVQLRTMHFTAMRSPWVIPKLVALVVEPQPRWTPEQVEAARRDFVLNPIEERIDRAWSTPTPAAAPTATP